MTSLKGENEAGVLMGNVQKYFQDLTSSLRVNTDCPGGEPSVHGEGVSLDPSSSLDIWAL